MRFPVNMRNCPDLGVAQPTKAFSGPISILWDMENCPIPVNVNTDIVASNILMALRVHPAVEGFVTMFSAYGDFNQFPRRLREGCQRTGINLIDVPNGRKDASDKAILVDMFLFALDNPPPCTILLITGDVDFAPALHKLGQRGYTVLLALPAAKAVASALCNAGQYVWDWPSVARGEGFVPAKALRLLVRERSQTNCTNVSGGLGRQSSDDSDHLMEDEPCMEGRYAAGRKVADGGSGDNLLPNHVHDVGSCGKVVDGGSGDNLHANHVHDVGLRGFVNAPSSNQPCQPAALIPTHMHTHTKSLQTLDTGTAEGAIDELWARPGDVEGLKNQLIKLLKLHGGRLSFFQVAGEYKKMYGRPLFLSEYGSLKLADLLRQLGDTFVIATIGGQKNLLLQECACASQTMHEIKGMCDKVVGQKKGYSSSPKEDGVDSTEEVILLRVKDQGKATIEEEANKGETLLPCGLATNDMTSKTNTSEQLEKLETFKRELQELLVSHACRILLASFWKVYHRRYSRELNLDVFGVADFDDLLKKVQDVATVIEEQGTERKFLVVTKSMDVQSMVGEEKSKVA